MKTFVALLVLLLPLTAIAALQGDSIPKIEIGKRKNLLFSPEIQACNVAQMRSGTLIYYRTAPTETYDNIGLFGNRLKPLLQDNPESMLAFRQFQQSRFGYVALNLGLAASATGFTITGLAYLLSNRRPDNFWIYPALGFGLMVGFAVWSVHVYRKGDRKLWKAVQIHNGTPDLPIPSCKARGKIGFSGGSGVGMAFLVDF